MGDGFVVRFPAFEGSAGSVFGRPVDVVEDTEGNIYVSDDYNGAIWRVALLR